MFYTLTFHQFTDNVGWLPYHSCLPSLINVPQWILSMSKKTLLCYSLASHLSNTRQIGYAHPSGECREHSVWSKDCNRCRCIGGRAVCTMKICFEQQEPKPGTGFQWLAGLSWWSFEGRRTCIVVFHAIWQDSLDPSVALISQNVDNSFQWYLVGCLTNISAVPG